MPIGPLDRRAFLSFGAASALVATLGCATWRKALGASAVVGESPYGPLGSPDLRGVALPRGFSARLLATSDKVVKGTNYSWHGQPDGASCFAHPEEGWVY